MRRVSSTKGRRWGAFLAVAVLSSLVVPLVGIAQANHGNARVLDVEPDTANRAVGALHTLTARLCEQAVGEEGPTCDDLPATVGTGPINIDFEFEAGSPNDPDGTTPLTPDMSCDVVAGQATCQVSYTTTAAGTDTIRAWIDHDQEDSTTEADATEGRNEMTMPGTGIPCEGATAPEPDCTDVVNVIISGGPPAKLDCDDQTGPDGEKETNPTSGSGRSETYTCLVRDSQNNPVGDHDPNTAGTQNLHVYAEIRNGVNDPDDVERPSDPDESFDSPDYSCLTGAGRGGNDPPVGQCTITVTQAEGESGTAIICFWADDASPSEGDELCGDELNTYEDGSDVQSTKTGNDLADQTEKTWEARQAGEGKGGLDAEVETDTNNVGDSHQITATVYDQFGQAFQGTTTVNFEWFQGSPADQANEGGDGNSPNTPDDSCTTNNASSCSITYTSSQPGRDLICVWTNNTPSMSGNNENGTCNGEGLTDADDTAGSADPPTTEGDDVDVVSKTWQKNPPATQLDCEPESGTAQRDASHQITCTATEDSTTPGTPTPVEGTQIDMEATGANDPDAGNSRTSPDFTCTTDAQGQCTMTHNPAGNAKGLTTYRAWIDPDYFNETDESDAAEGRDETTAGGDDADPDGTDVVENNWIHDSARDITINSDSSSEPAGGTVKISGKIVDADPECYQAETVRLRRRPPDGNRWKTIDNTLTNGNGRYEFTVVVRKTRDYKTVAPATPEPCAKATSPIIGVEAT